MTSRPDNWVRLACDNCDCDEYDGITEEQLAAVADAGWDGVSQVQTWEEAIKVYDDPAAEPPGYSVLDWWTHIGTCPDCLAVQQPIAQN